jgi:hypothetical protein
LDEKDCQTIVEQQHALEYFEAKIIATKLQKLGFWWPEMKEYQREN